ncbi:MAG: hypothetical protein HXY43_11105 [Fischerella sp.]|jgi:hypothetical protein|uniref:DUF6745 domain-containing protein n=1 Tax=Fischerella sp. TaxID=1191 RepID=UPI0018320050|nr:hypothetical protein [Fischerella sp.]NWF59813.1 hypothetical protein [Fischerella sp.]
MSHKIAKLTPEQEALIKFYREKWRNIALSTERIDRQKAIEGVKELYSLCHIEQPEIIFCESPYQAMSKALPQLEARIIQTTPLKFLQLGLGILKLFPNLTKRESKNVEIQRPSDVNIHINTTLYYRFISYMKTLEQTLKIDMADVLELDIDANLPELYHQLQFQLEKQYDSNFIPSFIFCSYCSWLDFWKSVFNYTGEQKLLQVLHLLAESSGCIFPYQRVAVVCDRPSKLSLDDQNRLHAEGEPAIQFTDGYNLYANSGVILPEKYGKLHPHQWQTSWLLEEKNAELRRVLIQGIGYTRMLEELQANELNSYREYTLLKIENEIDVEPIYLLKMTCPSTGFIHVLRVPSDLKSAQEAITWVNWGVAPEEFVVQT